VKSPSKVEDDEGDKSDNDFDRDDDASPIAFKQKDHNFSNTLDTVKEEEIEDTLA